MGSLVAAAPAFGYSNLLHDENDYCLMSYDEFLNFSDNTSHYASSHYDDSSSEMDEETQKKLLKAPK